MSYRCSLVAGGTLYNVLIPLARNIDHGLKLLEFKIRTQVLEAEASVPKISLTGTATPTLSTQKGKVF